MRSSEESRVRAGWRRILLMGLAIVILTATQQFCEADEAGRTNIQAIQAKRIATLEELVKLAQARYSQGQRTLDVVMDAMIELGEARVEVAVNQDGRTTALKNMLSVWKQYEDLVDQQVKNGIKSKEDLLRVRAARLKTELKLAREFETKGNSSTKD